jgi:hypothetical protein
VHHEHDVLAGGIQLSPRLVGNCDLAERAAELRLEAAY